MSLPFFKLIDELALCEAHQSGMLYNPAPRPTRVFHTHNMSYTEDVELVGGFPPTKYDYMRVYHEPCTPQQRAAQEAEIAEACRRGKFTPGEKRFPRGKPFLCMVDANFDNYKDGEELTWGEARITFRCCVKKNANGERSLLVWTDPEEGVTAELKIEAPEKVHGPGDRCNCDKAEGEYAVFWPERRFSCTLICASGVLTAEEIAESMSQSTTCEVIGEIDVNTGGELTKEDSAFVAQLNDALRGHDPHGLLREFFPRPPLSEYENEEAEDDAEDKPVRALFKLETYRKWDGEKGVRLRAGSGCVTADSQKEFWLRWLAWYENVLTTRGWRADGVFEEVTIGGDYEGFSTHWTVENTRFVW